MCDQIALPCPLPCPEPCPPCLDPCLPCFPCFLCPSPCSPCPPKRSFRELRGSILIIKCECVKRNGLQLDCPRRECKGRPLCTVRPIPRCCTSKWMWRYEMVTMGKPSFPSPMTNKCSPSPNCNPHVFDPCA
ncbi:CLUMA_CG006289, isoform A [Clunio marinus]|uniref:CLUMA_CG006289, isoform A n=1 Tax=Clunio marinus TaxID=568069 RepID=A0A1J1HXL5_9DIPT|nr:CLUMA_CG006289, isoform A [Clunio marinus]